MPKPDNSSFEEIHSLATDSIRGADTSEKQLKERAAKLTDTEKVIAERKRLTHAEVARAYEGGTSEAKATISRSLFRRALEELDVESLGSPKAQEIPDKGLDFSRMPRKRSPQVFFKQITEERRVGLFGGKREVTTDEVLVVVRLNNRGGEDGESTLVCGVVKQDKGKLLLGDEEPSLFRTLGEKEYQKEMRGLRKENPPALARFLHGDLTVGGYKKAFRKQEGMSLEDHWKLWDEDVVHRPEGWRAAEARDGVLDKIEHNYGELLTETRQRMEEISEAMEELKATAITERNKILGSEEIAFIMANCELRTPDGYEKAVRLIMSVRRMDRAEAEELIQAYKDRRVQLARQVAGVGAS